MRITLTIYYCSITSKNKIMMMMSRWQSKTWSLISKLAKKAWAVQEDGGCIDRELREKNRMLLILLKRYLLVSEMQWKKKIYWKNVAKLHHRHTKRNRMQRRERIIVMMMKMITIENCIIIIFINNS